jgi:hypothetical protein
MSKTPLSWKNTAAGKMKQKDAGQGSQNGDMTDIKAVVRGTTPLSWKTLREQNNRICIDAGQCRQKSPCRTM